jgi:glutamyl-tRNA synthetase
VTGRNIRTRFAPSPTGLIHIGNARTALFNYLFAKRQNGSFILRIEDTDTQRSTREYEAALLRDLKWLGLCWDEGPDIGGGHGPYRQSERLGLYKGFADRLAAKGLAYPCYCSVERLKGLKESQIRSKTPPRYDNRCRSLDPKHAPEGIKPAIRFKVPERTVCFIDALHGKVSFDARQFGDFVIMGSDGVASYNFAVVVDDSTMDITHIIRGDDHLSNTPRQALLCEALGFKAPLYCHIPLVYSPERTPLGKRDESMSISALRDEGYLSQAVVNAMARLGWSPPADADGLESLTSSFGLERLSKSPSVFDLEGLKALNKKAMSRMPANELARALFPRMAVDDWLKDAVTSARENAFTINGLRNILKPLVYDIELTDEADSVLKEKHAKGVLTAFSEEVRETERIDRPTARDIISKVREKTGEKGKRLMLPIRAALTGRLEGIELAEVVRLLGREKILERLKPYGA